MRDFGGLFFLNLLGKEVTSRVFKTGGEVGRGAKVTKLCRLPITSSGRIGLAGRIGSLTEWSQHLGLGLSTGIRSKPLMVQEKNVFEH